MKEPMPGFGERWRRTCKFDRARRERRVKGKRKERGNAS
jgi:hypothetical protein